MSTAPRTFLSVGALTLSDEEVSDVGERSPYRKGTGATEFLDRRNPLAIQIQKYLASSRISCHSNVLPLAVKLDNRHRGADTRLDGRLHGRPQKSIIGYCQADAFTDEWISAGEYPSIARWRRLRVNPGVHCHRCGDRMERRSVRDVNKGVEAVKGKACPTSPGAKEAPFMRVPLLPNWMSLVLPSPGHQPSDPVGGSEDPVSQSVAPGRALCPARMPGPRLGVEQQIVASNPATLFCLLRKSPDASVACKDAPLSRPVQPPALGKVTEIPQVGGLHHLYIRKAA